MQHREAITAPSRQSKEVAPYRPQGLLKTSEIFNAFIDEQTRTTTYTWKKTLEYVRGQLAEIVEAQRAPQPGPQVESTNKLPPIEDSQDLQAHPDTEASQTPPKQVEPSSGGVLPRLEQRQAQSNMPVDRHLHEESGSYTHVGRRGFFRAIGEGIKSVVTYPFRLIGRLRNRSAHSH